MGPRDVARIISEPSELASNPGSSGLSCFLLLLCPSGDWTQLMSPRRAEATSLCYMSNIGAAETPGCPPPPVFSAPAAANLTFLLHFGFPSILVFVFCLFVDWPAGYEMLCSLGWLLIHSVAKVSPKLLLLLPPPSRCWDYRCAPQWLRAADFNGQFPTLRGWPHPLPKALPTWASWGY